MKKYNILLLISILAFPTQANVIEISSWGYQLQNYDLTQLIESPHELLVLDYSKDGSDDERFTNEEINQIKDANKIVLSYISIGEAEDYRYYFNCDWINNPPVWMDGENPNWPGNFKVQYWNSEWQTIIFSYLDRIISQGFDGVYLDIIDAFEFYENMIENADLLMIDFVQQIANYGRKDNSGFLIIPQNGEVLLENQSYLKTVDGIGREDVYILQDEQIRRDASESIKIENDLDLLTSQAKLVLVVDYSTNTNLINYARTSAATKGYISYIGSLDLDKLLSIDYTGTNSTDRSMPISPFIIFVVFVITVNLKRFKDKSL